MFIELVDLLRCPNPHEDTWLVAQMDRVQARQIMTGTIGCPICSAEYPVREGIVYFTEHAPRMAWRDPSDQDAMRLAAALDLTEARTVAVLHGVWGAHASIVRGLSPSRLLLVNPPEGVEAGDGISIVLAETAPLASAAANAVAMDAAASGGMRASLTRALQPRGRMLAPLEVALPDDLTELVRDDEVWVAEAPAGVVSPPIQPLRRRS
jgi:uncharacterized protein YbaR (Trm112 family)